MDFFSAINSSQTLIYIFIRSFLLFLVSIFIIRYGNRRYRLNSSFDYLLLIIIGGVFSRGIVGASSLLVTVVGTISLVLAHRVISVLTFYHRRLELLLKGSSRPVIKNGELLKKQLKKYHLTELDILAEMRTQLHTDDLTKIKTAYLESIGKLSFVRKDT